MPEANPKARAWDALGLKYYFLGRRSGKPTTATVRWFTGDLGPLDRCMVAGGTSVGVVRAAARAGCPVTVVDFSTRVCDDLRRHVGPSVSVLQRDVLAPAPDWDGSFSHLLCDALLNRFDQAEARRFVERAGRLLRRGGRLRATVKIGLYPMDERLLRIAALRALEPAFWDEGTRTIDYGKLGPLLEEGFVRHGGIAERDLLGWYRNRGREKRFDQDDLRGLLAGAEWAEVGIEPEHAGSDRVRVAARRT